MLTVVICMLGQLPQCCSKAGRPRGCHRMIGTIRTGNRDCAGRLVERCHCCSGARRLATTGRNYCEGRRLGTVGWSTCAFRKKNNKLKIKYQKYVSSIAWVSQKEMIPTWEPTDILVNFIHVCEPVFYGFIHFSIPFFVTHGWESLLTKTSETGIKILGGSPIPPSNDHWRYTCIYIWGYL